MVGTDRRDITPDRPAQYQNFLCDENSTRRLALPETRDKGGGSSSSTTTRNAAAFAAATAPATTSAVASSASQSIARDRSTTCPTIPNPSSRAMPPRPRADTTNAQSSPPRSKLASRSTGYRQSSSTLEPTTENPIHAVRHQSPTKPIDIPQRTCDRDRPTTPLTARTEPGHYFPLHLTRAAVSPQDHHRRSYSASSKASSQQSIEPSPATMSPRGTHHATYRPTSPLSPSSTLPIPIPASPTSQPRQRRPPQSLNLPGLPKYHPANFPGPDGKTPLSPRAVRTFSTQTRSGRGSDAQHKLAHYQREMMLNANKQSTLLGVPSSLCAKPTSPRLLPLDSPGASMTPLALESHGDYLLAGSKLSHASMQEAEAREWVEKLVQKENERRVHPDTRSSSLSPSVSPAVSPAGGRS